MRIAVLGAGAMGRLFAALLSRRHDVLLMDRNPERAQTLDREGVILIEPDGARAVFHPHTVGMGSEQAPADLVLVLVKAMGTRASLERCRGLIGPKTLLLTLQNGGGHEEVLAGFAPLDRVLIGTTQHNASVREDGSVFHGGSGRTVIGSPLGESEAAKRVAAAFAEAGLETEVTDNIRRTIWQKLMTNASLSALTGVMGMPMGFVAASASCWTLCERLIREAVQVAAADGVAFDAEEKIAEVRAVAEGGPMGITSICADLLHGRKTEVDTISGSVVRAARRLHVSAPCHEMMVLLIHAMEDRNEERPKANSRDNTKGGEPHA